MIFYGVQPPQFLDDNPERMSWFSTIFRYVQSKTGVISQTASYNVPWDIYWIRMNATGGVRTVTFPKSANSKGRQIGIIKTDASGNSVTATASSGDTINGTAATTTQWGAMVFIADGTTNWDRVT